MFKVQNGWIEGKGIKVKGDISPKRWAEIVRHREIYKFPGNYGDVIVDAGNGSEAIHDLALLGLNCQASLWHIKWLNNAVDDIGMTQQLVTLFGKASGRCRACLGKTKNPQDGLCPRCYSNFLS